MQRSNAMFGFYGDGIGCETLGCFPTFKPWKLAFQEIFRSRIMKNTETQLALTNIELVLNHLVKICENESDLVKDRVCNKINIYSNDFCLAFLLISQRLSIHLS